MQLVGAEEEAWRALNKWILEKMTNRRGVHVGFARFTWQLMGPLSARPVFALTESFCKAHNLPWCELPSVLDCSEVDVSTLALRYSSLTKDAMFCALREIAKTLGELLRGTSSIKMSIGVLTSEDGKVKFTFDPMPAMELQARCSSLLAMDNPVLAQALERCIAAVSTEAARSELEEATSQAQRVKQEEDHQRQIDERLAKQKELQLFLRKQMLRKQTPLYQVSKEVVGSRRSVAEALNQPTRCDQLPGPFKKHTITGGPTRGRATRLSPRQVKKDIEDQIESQNSESKARRKAMLDEERRFVDHVHKEMERMRKDECDKAKLQHRAMLDAWNQSRHVKNMQKLASLGTAKLLEYTKSVGFDPRDAPKQGGKDLILLS